MSEQNQEVEQSQELVLDELVCDVCFEGNLSQSVGIRNCLKCEKAYCSHFASKVDPAFYCVNCFSDLKITISDPEVQVIEHYNTATNKTVRFERRPKGRRIRIEGGGFLFAQRVLQDANDAEKDLFIEYYRAVLNFLLHEAETKKLEKAHKAAAVKISLGTTTPASAPASTKTTVTKTVKTVTTKMNKALEQAKAAMFALYGGVLTMEQIEDMLNAAQKGKGGN